MNRGFRTGRSLSKRFSTATSPTNSSKPVVDRVGIFVFSTITLVTAGLGVWQLKRYDEKVLKIKETKKTLKNDMVIIKPDEVTQESLTLSMIQHRNQRVNLGPGTYLNHKEVLLGQRTGPAGKLGRAQGMAMNAQVSHLFYI